MQEILRHICEKRQFDFRDYYLTYENAKKKQEEVDLTLQFRQYDNLKEVTLQKCQLAPPPLSFLSMATIILVFFFFFPLHKPKKKKK